MPQYIKSSLQIQHQVSSIYTMNLLNNMHSLKYHLDKTWLGFLQSVKRCAGRMDGNRCGVYHEVAGW